MFEFQLNKLHNDSKHQKRLYSYKTLTVSVGRKKERKEKKSFFLLDCGLRESHYSYKNVCGVCVCIFKE